MARSSVTIGGIPLRVNPAEIRWNFKIKTVDHKCLGGKVIQVLGTTLGDITLRGSFGAGDRSQGDTEGWQSQVRFRKQVETWADAAVNAQRAQPILFTYAPRGWSFQVFVKSLSPVHMDVETINPRWELVLFPVDEGSRAVVQGVKDLYIKRLMNGVGWKQTEYNGPTQQEVDDLLSPFGGSAVEYVKDQYVNAFEEGSGQ